MIGFDISKAKGYNFGNESVSEVYYGSTRIWPHDYSRDYLTIEALYDNNTVTLYNAGDINNLNNIYYSLDNGYSWTQYSNPITLNQHRTLLLKGNITSNDYGSINICSTEECNVYGNIMSLLYSDNFVGQSSLLNKRDLFKSLFTNNSNICKVVDASNLILPATTLVSGCYGRMFSGCTSLTTAPALPATTLASYCYEEMFYGCTSLTTAPQLPATTLTRGCYAEMFDGCASLTTAPALPATTLADECYGRMFSGCTSLTTAPALPATTLASACYEYMFSGCTSLTTAPALPTTTLASACYHEMFRNCTSLNYIICLATDISATNCTSNWVQGVASTGTFIKSRNISSWTTGVNGIPRGWTSQDASYEDEYFTIEAINNNTQISFLAQGSISSNLTDKLKYSLDDGTTWNNFTIIIDVSGHPATDLMTLNSGDRIMLKAQNLDVYTEGAGNVNGAFTILTSDDYNVSGNIMSLAYGDYFIDKKSLVGLPSYYFANLFNPTNFQHNLVDASNLILPATTLSEYCYYRMFNLCNKLTTAPELPASTLVNSCYSLMFASCSNLSYIKCLATDISAQLCTMSWTDGVSQTGTFVKDASMQNWTSGVNGIPSGWTVQDAS